MKTPRDFRDAGNKPISLMTFFQGRRFRRHLALFVAFNIALFIWIFVAHTLIPLNVSSYTLEAHHYLKDSRIDNPESFSLLRSLGQYDAQFYLQIADSGYPDRFIDGANMQYGVRWLSYAFSPLYPALVSIVNLLIQSVEVSAFIVSFAALIAAFSLVYWLVLRRFSEELAVKTAWLMFLFPASIFFRSYFSEGLFVVLLALLLDSLISKKWLAAVVSAGLLSVTRFVGVGGVVVTFIAMILAWNKKRLKTSTSLKLGIVLILPLVVFFAYCFIKTGNPFYFLTVRKAWPRDFYPPLATIWSILHFWILPWHMPHASRLDVISIVASGVLLFFSRKWLPRSWWTIALLLWLFPILTSDTMSSLRYQTVNLPLFIYAANIIRGKLYYIVLATSAIGLLIASLYFVNWRWVG